MDRFINQFRRIGSDHGKGDADFTVQEEKVRQSQERLKQATQELVRASERLNDAALGVDLPEKRMH